MRRQILASFAALLLLTACQSRSNQSADAVNAGAAGAGAGANQGVNQAAVTAPRVTETPPPTRTGATPGSINQFITEVGDRVFFDFDKFDVKPEGRATLEKQANWLRQYPNTRITIEGHADERGTREYNLALGERRANSVLNMLTALGVPANRITVVSFGKERPAVLGSNEAAWAQNRRAVSVITAGAPAM
jgi:peptidoglycan-associated lipoprotein